MNPDSLLVLLMWLAGIHAVGWRTTIWGFAANHWGRRQGTRAIPGGSVGLVLPVEGVRHWQEHGQRQDLLGEALQ